MTEEDKKNMPSPDKGDHLEADEKKPTPVPVVKLYSGAMLERATAGLGVLERLHNSIWKW